MAPIIPQFPDVPKSDKPVVERQPMIVCTRDPAKDAGLECPYCGWLTGDGHGAKR